MMLQAAECMLGNIHVGQAPLFIQFLVRLASLLKMKTLKLPKAMQTHGCWY